MEPPVGHRRNPHRNPLPKNNFSPPFLLPHRGAALTSSLRSIHCEAEKCELPSERRSDQRRTWPRLPAARLSPWRRRRRCGARPERVAAAAKVRQRLGGISPVTFWRWRHNPKLGFPPGKCINGRWYFPWNSVRRGVRSSLRLREPLIIAAFHQYRSSSEWATGL